MEKYLVTLVLIALVLALIIGGGVGYLLGYEQGEKPPVTTFDACAAAGYPVMESYPERCMTPDGRTFTREIPPPEMPTSSRPLPPLPEPIACPMDALICPDGSAVGRTGPNCEFAPCP